MLCEENDSQSLFFGRLYHLSLISVIYLEVRIKLAFLFVVIFATFPSAAFAGDLTVEVLGIRSNKGLIHYGLYNNSSTFLKSDGRLDGAKESINNNRSVFVFKGLSPGPYAVAVFHDENLNEEFDSLIFGLPAEDYGFSNNAIVFFGPPNFNDATVVLPPEGLSISIRVD